MKEKDQHNGVKEIARCAGVSLATVDRVIHNRTGVSATTRSKVNRIIAELNYQPNIFARQLASRKKITLAVLIPKLSAATSYWQAPLNGVEQAEKELAPLGISIKIFQFDLEKKNSFKQQAGAILRSGAAGVLLAPLYMEEATVFVKACNLKGIACVLMDADIPALDKLSYIGPDLHQSGCLAGHLLQFGISEGGKVLVLNISEDFGKNNDSGNHHRLLQKEAGINSFLKQYGKQQEIISQSISKTSQAFIHNTIVEMLQKHPSITAVCVTNSRVAAVAGSLVKIPGKRRFLIGFDFTSENIEWLENGMVDFIICDRPREQSYRGIMVLYKHLVLELPVKSIDYMPIDIITKENYRFYQS